MAALHFTLLLCISWLAVAFAAEPTRRQTKLGEGERRQIFRDEVDHLKKVKRPAGTNHGYYQPQEDGHQPPYQDSYRPETNDDYRPTYQKPDVYDEYDQHQEQKPYVPPPPQYEDYEPVKPVAPKPYKPAVPKPYKPRPTYPKEVVLLKPSLALKSNAYADKYTTPNYRPSHIPGTPGEDYPNYTAIPETSFDCLNFKNTNFNYMFSDRESGCQVFHTCHDDGRQDSFLCPLGTIFDVESQTCDWWFNVRCI
ncbi:hypothetical protein GHT06_014196 [Daphnia sinensis]|uniref:Chitin-binding type-2 domain-containing protein n=1 Tax=Daphnia sinensis TaxID=1820382 RepID=A0AAD5KW57_9CRUS|nr:hypothetical protein GHT06_014196 [Daphnia sinensis]